MANIDLVTWTGHLVTPQDDALVYEVATGQSGIIYGAAVTIKNSNTLHIAAGHGIVCGRKFTIEDGDVALALSPAGTLLGRLYIRLDLSNTTAPITLLTETGTSLTPVEQDNDVNIIMGVYEFNLCTFTVSETAISDLVNTTPMVVPTAVIAQEAIEEMEKKLFLTAYRGKNLGTALTDEQASAIAAGDFTDLWNGDYWEINGHRWRIVDNRGYFLERGDVPFTAHHLVIMPDDNLLKADGSTTRYMKDTNDTTGGYAATKYRQTYRAQCKAQFTAAFGAAHIANFRDLQTTTMANGHAAGWAWADADVELPNEASAYGTIVWGDGYGHGYNTGILNKQFSLFDIAPEFLIAKTMEGARENYWLRDVVSAAAFSHVYAFGLASTDHAAGTHIGLRPFALLI